MLINLKVLIVQYLEMKMVNGGKSTQAVITQTEIWISSFGCHVKCKQEALVINFLGQTLENPGNQ